MVNQVSRYHDPRNWEEVVVYIFIYITKYVFSLTSYISIIMILFILIIRDVHKDLSSLRMKVQIEDDFIYISWINRWGRILIRYSIYR